MTCLQDCLREAELEALCDRKDARIAELEAALRQCMVGGNHLPLIFGVDHPHAGVPADAARQFFGPGNKYEAWCCWDAIMRARDVLDNE